MTSSELNRVRKESKFLNQLSGNYSFFSDALKHGRNSRLKKAYTIHVLVNIDFKSWNLYRRPIVTYATMEFLGRVFNLPLAWIRANTFFSQCLVFPSDALHPPAGVAKAQGFLPKPCESAWYHHNSGFEGIMQKAWIFDTIVDFWDTCGRANLKYQLMGPGDNQGREYHHRDTPR